MTPDTSAPKPAILLIGTDAAFLKTVEAALSQSRAVAVSAIAEPIEQAGKRPELDAAAVLVVAIDAKRRESLGALQALVGRLGGRVPVVVLTDSFDDALARWFLQIKVSDFLRKPVEPKEVLRACLRALRSSSSLPDDEGRILTFLAAAGGVGTTTLAIETALQLSRGARGLEPTCLVDLDFQGAACADYLDLDPRLDLDEIGPHPERLDLQLLDVMLARHASGLSLLAARGRPGERCTLDPEVVIRILDLVSSRFENVVIDLPRVWEPWTDQVLLGSNRVYVVTDMTVPGLRLARRMAGALCQRLPEVKPRVIVNRFEQQLFGAGLRRADIERALDGFLEGTVSNSYKVVREAIDRGTTLDQIKAGNAVSADLKKIVFTRLAAE
ncbi:MAG TPA: response regulator receiver protein [Beijerinckiaceae bacterium]|nr:response regulator receiver protein [Beijerinckiaceae bacterium]